MKIILSLILIIMLVGCVSSPYREKTRYYDQLGTFTGYSIESTDGSRRYYDKLGVYKGKSE